MGVGKDSQVPLLQVAGGAAIAAAGLVGLLVAGLLGLNGLGLGGWLGWFNLAVLSCGWWLAWVWTRPGAVLPAPNWSPLSHFTENDKRRWERARLEIAAGSAELAATDKPADWFRVVRGVWDNLQVEKAGATGVSWRDKTLAELMAAIHAGQVRFSKRAEALLGHLSLPRIERWELAWQGVVLFDRYGMLAWIPGLILAPVDALARYLAGRIIRSPVAGGIRRDSTRMLWELVLRDLAVVVVDFQAGRLKGGGARYATLLETADTGTRGLGLVRPFLLAITQGLPLLVLAVAGVWHLATVHWLLIAAGITMIAGGLALAARGAGDWLLPPLPATGEGLEAGRAAAEQVIHRLAEDIAGKSIDSATWIAMAEAVDRDVAMAVNGSASGWRGRSLGEWLRGVESVSQDLEQWVRRTVPGSRHVNLGTWVATGGWLGWKGAGPKGDAGEASAQPARGGIIGRAFNWVADKVKQKSAELLIPVVVRGFGRQIGDFFVDLHSGRWRYPAQGVEGRAAGISRPVLLVAGSAGAGVTTIVRGLQELPELAEWEIAETSSLCDPLGKTGDDSVMTAMVRSANAVILVLRAVGAAREPEVRLVRMCWGQTQEAEVPAPVLGLLSMIDLIPPALEWNPPYDMPKGHSRKEQSMRECLEAARDGMGEGVVDWGVAGVRDGQWWGLREVVVPWVESSLERARGVRLARELAKAGEGRDWLEPARQAGRVLKNVVGLFRKGSNQPGSTA